MNQAQPYMDMHSAPHMSSAQSYGSHPATAGSMQHYPQYPQTMQPGSHYAPAPNSYSHYGYTNGVTSPQSASHPGSGPVGSQVQPQSLPLPAMMPAPSNQHSYVAPNATPAQGYQPAHQFDTTGQIAPPGMKPRVTATLWEDEGSLCFQVEAKGVCVARREDNHFINGTKLLNVAGMTRGRRDGILKSEKTRHVVKIGPMHLKGVWIPFERALDFANKEKITDQLYPLFVHNIGGLLYNPENASRTSAVVAATERRRMDSVEGSRPVQSSQPPSLVHHHSMQSTVGSQLPPTPHSIAPHPGAGRPGIDRAHTFPTPPTSASSVLGMGNQGSSYEWGGQNIGNPVTSTQPLSIDTGLSNTRSMPTTPATTPPGANIQSMQPYQGQTKFDSFDSSKQYYASTPGSQNGYSQQQNMNRYGQPLSSSSYSKDMGPPSAPGSGAADGDHQDHKAESYSHVSTTGHLPPSSEVDGGDHHENGYMSSNAAAYGPNRSSYAYNPATDHPHLSPDLTGSPSHQTGSGRGTPRTMPGAQQQWPQDYQTPPRPAPASNLYSVMGDSRAVNGAPTNDTYAPASYSTSSHSGPLSTGKRSREDDDQDQGGRPSSRDLDGSFDSKRRKMGRPDTYGAPMAPNAQMHAIKSGGGSSRQR